MLRPGVVCHFYSVILGPFGGQLSTHTRKITYFRKVFKSNNVNAYTDFVYTHWNELTKRVRARPSETWKGTANRTKSDGVRE